MSPLKTFIRRPVFTGVLAVALMVFGIFSFPRIGIDLYPDVEFPVVMVTTLYPGADPETMERDVSEILEEPISTISGLESVKSVNVESLSLIIVQFELEKDAAEAAQEVRDKVSGAVGELPDDVEAPVVEKFDMDSAPVLTLAMSGQVPVQELTRLADDVVKPALQREAGVGAVDVVGGREREIRVVVDPDRLRAHGLAITDVAGALKGQNLDAPAGRTLEPGLERSVRLTSEAQTVDEVRAIVVASPNGVPVRLRDVATVLDGPEEARSAATFEGTSTVAFSVQKQSGANTVAVADALAQAVEKLQTRLPEGVSLAVVDDGSRYIEHSIAAVQEDLLVGAILAVLIVLLFLRNWRSTIIAAIALPTSVVGTFAAMHALGFTFNIVSMLALTLSIGLLIDDAIVVIENIVRKLEHGATPFEAALEGTQEIALAVLAVTLAILAVFVPVAFMEGVMGRFFFQFGVTIAVAVLISYAVSMTLTPMMSARLLKQHARDARPNRASRAIEHALEWLEAGYGRVVAILLRHRGKTMAAAAVVLVATVALGSLLTFTFIPQEDRSAFQVTVKLPDGATLERTRSQVADVEQQVRELPGVKDVYASAGGGTLDAVNEGTLRVNLVPIAERAHSQQDLQAMLRERLAVPSGVKVTVQQVSSMGDSRQELQYNLRGADWDALVATSEKLVAAMQTTPGFVDVDTSFKGGKPQIDVRLDPERAAALGVQAASVGGALRAYMGGDEVSEFRDRGESYDIVLALPDALRADPAVLRSLQVRSTTGQLVELGNVAHLDATTGPAQIDRESRQRQITVLANLRGRSLSEATSWVDAWAKTGLPASVQGEWDGSAEMMADSGAAFASALLLGMILVFLILAAQFESVVDPISIMASLPFAVIGAIGSLLVTNTPMSMFAMIGIILLMGLVTKNGILLVEFARQRKEEGRPTFDALVEAGRVRLRPILMTTVAMIGGMIPAALATGDGAETRGPMAIVIIGGLVTSTFLTLGVVPVVYSLLDSLRARVAARRGRTEPEAARLVPPEPEA
ncbi:MAG TPA: efflux RND transporter permease subunit, partial [Anaeromyxobacteraceae bacterium]|nr:efflux RND transporter permease subunit [Anaeromyxobacteraceae bacterium]